MSLDDLGEFLSCIQNKYIDTMNFGTIIPQGNYIARLLDCWVQALLQKNKSLRPVVFF